MDGIGQLGWIGLDWIEIETETYLCWKLPRYTWILGI